MVATAVEVKDIVIQKITYEAWKDFDASVNASTNDVFTIDLSDRLGDVFIDVDWKNNEEMIIDPSPLLNGVFLDGRLVGLIDYKDTTSNGKEVTVISFLLIHPDEQGKGIGKALVKKVIQESKLSHIKMYPCTHASKVLCTQLGFKQDREFCGNWDDRLFIK